MVTVFRPSRTKHSTLLLSVLSALNVFGTSNNGVFRSVIYFRPKFSIVWAIIIIIINGCMYFSEFYS